MAWLGEGGSEQLTLNDGSQNDAQSDESMEKLGNVERTEHDEEPESVETANRVVDALVVQVRKLQEQARKLTEAQDRRLNAVRNSKTSTSSAHRMQNGATGQNPFVKSAKDCEQSA